MIKNKFARMFTPDGLLVPKKILKREVFTASKKFTAPEELNLRGYCTPVENQGDLPYCAAYSASSFAENILWRKRHYHEDIDPAPLYKYAKTIDGAPNTPGTFLECTLDALLKKGYFDNKICKIKTFGGKTQFGNDNCINDLKFAIHQYGCCLAGFNITDEWYSPGDDNTIDGTGWHRSEGGHAVTICGYDKDRVLIMNSWGTSYADRGFVWITNDAFLKQFIYGALLTNVLDD